MYPYVVEFLGTLLSVGALAFTGNPLYFLASLTVAIGLGGKISGGHFNPAVSTWAWLARKLPTNTFGLYHGAQLAAAAHVWILHTVM